jgi:hypothetical protein
MKAFTVWMTMPNGAARRLTIWALCRTAAVAEAEMTAKIAGAVRVEVL